MRNLFRLVALVLVTSFANSEGASISLTAGDLITNFTENAVVVSESTTSSYDLSDLTGLDEGQAIKISLQLLGNENLRSAIWVGNFSGSGTNLVTLNLSTTIRLSTGAIIDSASDTQSVGPLPADSFNASGYADLVDVTELSIVVPWGTDLSNVEITLEDNSFFTGNDAFFVQGTLRLGNAILSTSSIPEPSSAFFLVTGVGLVFLRRRKISTPTEIPKP